MKYLFGYVITENEDELYQDAYIASVSKAF
jgi:hypothetical protein